jgi:RND family efflux transporter MFP subunit
MENIMPQLKSIIVNIVTLLSVIFLFACSEPAKNLETETQLVRPVKVATVVSTNGDNIKTYPATVEPTQIAHLTFRVNGEIEKLFVVAGEHVKKGQLLARLDDRDFSLQLKQAQAKYELTKSQFNRSQQLFKEQLISSSAFDEAKAQLDIIEAQLNVAKTNMRYTSVVAPFDGIVAQLNIEQYEFIQAKQPIMELQGRKQVDIAIEVSENVMANLPKKSGSSIYQPTFVLDVNPDRKFKVTLKEHDIKPNATTKSYKVVFAMDIPKGMNVLSGMTGSLIVEMDQVLDVKKAYFSVPVESIFLPNQYAGQNKKFVYKLNASNHTVLTEVEVIKINNGSATIKPKNDDELLVGELVVATGSHLIGNGQQVKPWSRERGL